MAYNRKFSYIIDLNERGYFNAHVEDEGGKSVFELSNENDIFDDEGNPTGESEFGELWIIESGYMKHVSDIEGLKKYMVSNKIMFNFDSLKLVGGIH